MFDQFQSPFGTAVGLDICPDKVRVVVLKKRFNRFDVLTYGQEKITDIDNGMSHAIQSLYKRLNISSKEVFVHIEGIGVRQEFVDAPSERTDVLSEWVYGYIADKLPSIPKMKQFCFSYQILSCSEKNTKLLIAYCQPHILQSRIDSLENANVEPIMISVGRFDIAHSFMFVHNVSMNEVKAFIDLEEAGVSILVSKGGYPLHYHQIPLDGLDEWRSSGHDVHSPIENKFHQDWNDKNKKIKNTLFEWEKKADTKIDQITLTGEYADEESQVIFFSEKKIELAKPLQGLLKAGQYLPPSYSMATGLALRKFFPELNSIDLLSEEAREKRQQRRQKKMVTAFILSMGCIVLFALVGLSFVNSFYQTKLLKSQQQVQVFKTEIKQFENLKNKRKDYKKAITEIKKLVARRSQYARLLQEIGEIMPKGVWLEKIDLTAAVQNDNNIPSKNRSQVRIKGWSIKDEHITGLLQNLEQSHLLDYIQLIETSRISAKEVWRLTKQTKIPLVQFIIHCNVQ